MTLTPEQQQFLYQMLRSNSDATEFCCTLIEVLHTWDDLIDRDKPVSPEKINQAFWQALVELPRNPFYQQHFHDLIPCLMVAIQNWYAANAMEATESEADKAIAFILRSSYADIVIQAAYLIGGCAWARVVTPKIRREFHREGYAGYRANLTKQFNDAAQVAAGE
jgi:hypothetical protein